MKNRLPRSKKLNWAKFWTIVALAIIIVLGSALYIVRKSYYDHLKPVSTSQNNVLITVESGSTVSEIGVKLKEHGLIKAPWAFEWYVRNHDVRDKLQAGTYSLRPSQTVPEIVSVLTHGKVYTDLFRISPGLRIDQIKSDLINSGFSSESVEAALKPGQYADHPALADKPADASLEGYLYPESFQRTADTKPETLIRQSLDEMQKRLTPQIRAAFAKQGLTTHQGVIIASIVEQEVNNASDKPMVAQVFLRRYRQGIQLGSDVTAFYGAITNGQPASVGFDSPYNTRIHNGLTPGPISNVSESSLQAVAYPADTDFLYFVAGDGADKGKTYFSHTLAEHEALTRAHCTELCQ